MLKEALKILPVLSVLILIFAGFVGAERLPVKIYTSDDGIGSSAIFSLVRDSRGFIWLCSRDGLVRFDGYRFITYRIGNEDADPAVFSLIPTRRGTYWINLNRGTDYRFTPKPDSTMIEPLANPATKNDLRIPLSVEPQTERLLPAFEDSAGNLWSTDNKGIYLMHEVEGRYDFELIELNLPGNPDQGLTAAAFRNGREGDFWIGTHWGLVRRLPDGKMIHYALDPKNNRDTVLYFAEDKERRVWIARPEGVLVLKANALSELANSDNFTALRAVVKPGIVATDGKAQLPEQANEAVMFSFADILRRDTAADVSKTDYLKPELYGIICGADGKIWMIGNHGLIVFDGQAFQHYTIKQGLGADILSSIVEDNGGHIWLASYGGLHRINPKGLSFFDEAEGLEKARIHSIYENRDGELQVVSGNFNISSLESGVAFKMVHPGLPRDSNWNWQSNAALLDSRGDWWVNTQTAVYRYTGVSRIEDLNNKPPTAVYNSSNGLIGNNNLRVFEDSGGDIWFSTWVTEKRQGLTRWQRSTETFQQFFKEDGLPEIAAATAFAEDGAGNLWIGFSEGGLVRYRDGRFTAITGQGNPTNAITNIYRDTRGRMWIATSREGLSRVDAPEADHPVFKRYTIADGLTSNNLRCITEDLYGNIYVGTVRGVNRLSPETGHVKYYGTSDGLASDFINTAYRDRRGAIWFGTFNGLSKLVPEPDQPLLPPPVLISGLRIAGEDYSVSPLGQHEVFVTEQNANRNNLQIDFLSISTGGDASTRYQYRLEGADADWSAPTTDRSVTFANLLPGTYRFLVRAVNADDVVSPQPAVVSFTVLRPLWQRWWFLVLAAFLVGLAIYTIYRYRIAQIIKLERVRTRIATDLHDDIGSSLSKIAILSEVVRQKNGAGQNGTSEPLEIIANTSRSMVDSMSDIVWAINPERDHLNDLVQRMRHFSEEILDAQDVEYQFSDAQNLKNITLGADVRREVYMIFKECVNNLAKHSKCTKAEFEIRLENENLIVEIRDNGRGFAMNALSDETSSAFTADANGSGSRSFGGNGLKNMRRRAKNLGGELRIDSEIGKGTRIVLQIPVGKKLFSV